MIGDVAGKGVAASMLMTTSMPRFAASPRAVSRLDRWWKTPTAYSAKALLPDNSRLSS